MVLVCALVSVAETELTSEAWLGARLRGLDWPICVKPEKAPNDWTDGDRAGAAGDAASMEGLGGYSAEAIASA